LLVARLGNLISGHAGVGPALCRFLVDRDRPLGPDLDRLIGVLERDELPLP
jgi:hypothetical protein